MVVTHPLQKFRLEQSPPWSRAKLARHLGVERPTVFRWETGDRFISRDMIASVSEKTGIPARELRPDWAEKLEAAE